MTALPGISNPAEGFLSDAQKRGDVTERNPFQDIRRLFQQTVVPLLCCFKLNTLHSDLRQDQRSGDHSPEKFFDFMVLIAQLHQIIVMQLINTGGFQ